MEQQRDAATLNAMPTISQQMVYDLNSDRSQLCARLSYRTSRSTANPRITRLIRSEKSSRNTKTRKVNN